MRACGELFCGDERSRCAKRSCGEYFRTNPHCPPKSETAVGSQRPKGHDADNNVTDECCYSRSRNVKSRDRCEDKVSRKLNRRTYAHELHGDIRPVRRLEHRKRR